MDNNHRIAYNTVFMYFRMLVTVILGLITSRLVLKYLGVTDYGLYNVIGGIIAMFGFLNGAMTNTTSRYITFYLGKGEPKKLADIFSMAFTIHLIIATIIIVLGETIGLWYLQYKLVIPEGRHVAAFWLYQMSIISSILNILYVPFNATIVAHEKMSAFAYISIYDAFLKFLIALSLAFNLFDQLIQYGSLILTLTITDILIYYTYCHKHFPETRVNWFWDKSLFNEMFGFAGWSMFGNLSFLFYSQGLNLMINAFCGPVVNAARGIAVQVEGIVRQFATNVQMALNPQLIKSYAENDKERVFTLVYASSKYCYYLLFMLAIPVIFECDYLLHLWLIEVPNHAVNFIRLTLVVVLFDSLSNPLFTLNLSTGKVRIYQIVLSTISYLMMPITYLAIKFSLVPESVFVCLLICTVLEQIARIFIANVQTQMPVRGYLLRVIFPIIAVSSITVIIPACIYIHTPPSIYRLFATCVSIVVMTAIAVYLVGMTKQERIFLKEKIRCIKLSRD